MVPSAERRGHDAGRGRPVQEEPVAAAPGAPAGGTDADLVRLLHDALGRLGLEVRVEPMPDEARLAGGYCVVRGTPTLFLAPTASLAAQRDTLIEALRAIGTENIWLPPAVRAVLEEP